MQVVVKTWGIRIRITIKKELLIKLLICFSNYKNCKIDKKNVYIFTRFVAFYRKHAFIRTKNYFYNFLLRENTYILITFKRFKFIFFVIYIL